MSGEPKILECPKCGADLKPGMQSCPNCGAYFAQPVGYNPQPTYTPPPQYPLKLRLLPFVFMLMPLWTRLGEYAAISINSVTMFIIFYYLSQFSFIAAFLGIMLIRLLTFRRPRRW